MSTRKPLVAVCGRPNVGKSTFFNKVCGKRISIVKDTPGVTRDRIYADAEWCGYHFTLVDTGGLELNSEDAMYRHILSQARAAMESADVILFFTDAKSGLVASDHDAAELLRQTNKPVILVVNKLDNFELEKTYDFYALGLGEPHPISCEQLKGIGDLLDVVVGHFDRVEPAEDKSVKIAVVGRPNVGKSSLVNRILGTERVIVSDMAGTTRDAIDTPFTYNQKNYTLIDTAGMRRKRSIEDETVEDYSVMRTLSAISRADVVLTLFDAGADIAEQDIRIAGHVHEEGKPGLILMNKWDLVEKDSYTIRGYEDKLKERLNFMDYFVPLFISAKTGLRTEKVLRLVDTVYENAGRRVTTGILNDMLAEAVRTTEPPTHKGRRLKLFYITQAASRPPTFVVFVNDAELVHFSYARYLENYFRKTFDFAGTPIRFIFKNRKEEGKQRL
ncbi:MAG: ribosome biogenesis GTPase Der [Clostridiales bacterium]|jgi:GTP-binding protein|nr:ribosome biogenesis GTPase Der [Clostridiales bacterium]